MKIQIKSRWSSNIVFECDIEASENTSEGFRLGLAVKIAVGRKAVLRGADLSGAVLRGADLSGADLSGADLSGAVLRDAVLRGADLSGAVLRGADLSGADLSGADLSGAVLRDAVLSGAVLRGAVLRGADLRGADWIPRIENIHQKVYAAASAPEALNMGSWHQDGYCGTTHCRAGWVCVLAGPGGKVLEGVYGTDAAAALIYQASDPKLERVPSWYATNSEALNDMKRLAEAEAVVA
ncbi:pentapeptide repeat-containing protein [Gemmobacter sp. 24YEA27]|uniref:pentapeptide repeat-containing protein n=1 Tax=Gemmobacter sp. 24YEA27 TaxID=3040672 RepID=UPI0024B3A933|nr:pentapeptide repeat-containing protein [Gemmobacter sp. 24YEA27]